MKKIFTIVAAFMLLSSCAKKAQVKDLATDYIGTPSSQTESVLKYENCSEEKLYKGFKELKCKIDEELNMLPTETIEMEVNTATGHIYTQYIWETPERYVYIWVEPESGFIEVVDRKK